MQDLEVIIRNNAKAVEEHALKWTNEAPGRRTALINPITEA